MWLTTEAGPSGSSISPSGKPWGLQSNCRLEEVLTLCKHRLFLSLTTWEIFYSMLSNFLIHYSQCWPQEEDIVDVNTQMRLCEQLHLLLCWPPLCRILSTPIAWSLQILTSLLWFWEPDSWVSHASVVAVSLTSSQLSLNKSQCCSNLQQSALSDVHFLGTHCFV